MYRAVPSCRHLPKVSKRPESVVALVRVCALTIVPLLLLMPVTAPVPTFQQAVNEPVLVENTFAEASNFIRVNLPYSVKSIAVGTTSLGPGFAYIHGGLLRFKNPVTLVDDSVDIGTESVVHETLTSADMDNDSHSEFLIMEFGMLPVYCLVIDFDDHSSMMYPCQLMNPIEILTGDFDGNGRTDFAVYNQGRLVIVNMTDGSTMGSFPFTGQIARACVGDFSKIRGDEIAVLYNEHPQALVQTVSGLVGPIDLPVPTLMVVGCDIGGFRYGVGSAGIAVTLVDIGGTGDRSSLKAYYGNLTPMFTVSNPSSRGPPFVKTGQFNGDLQEDFAVLSMIGGLAWFVNGYDGSTIRTSVEQCYGTHWRAFATAVLDSDSFTDVAVAGPRGQLSLMRGVNGQTGYEEPRSPGPFTQVLTYDIDSDGRKDILALTDKIDVLLSDTSPPEVSLEPLFPTHPTFYDSYFKIELTATDELTVSSATIYVRPVGGIVTVLYQPHQMIRTPNGKFLYIMAGLQPSDFNYYIEVVDPYLNAYSYGNETSPKTLTVEGHFAWGHFHNTTIEQAQTHVLALGNNSAGEDRMFVMALEPSSGTATMHIYSPTGTEITQVELVSTSTMSTFEVYSGMLDGDNMLDPVVAEYNKTYARFRVFHGSNLTLWKDSTYLIPSALVQHGSMVFDDDRDMVDEIHYMGVNGTTYYLIRADNGLLSWANVTLAGNATIVGAAHATIQPPYPQLGILRGDDKVDIYEAYNLTCLDTLDYSSPGSTLNDFPVTIRDYHNASHPTDSFLAVYGGWDLDTAVTYMCMVDADTLTVGGPRSYVVPGRHVGMIALYDSDADANDEVVFFDNLGNVSLFDFSYAEIRRWTVFVTEAGPLSNALLDYDGDGADELLISTSDDMLTAIGLSGVLDYQAKIGMLFNMVNIGNVDPGSGEDLAAFPILRAAATLGAVRDLELFYVLDVSFALESNMVLQGMNVWANTTVLNVFHESVPDAFVSLTAQYRFGTGVVEQNFGSIYDNSTNRYSSAITPNWPMGMVNMSLAVTHEYYDSYQDNFPNALRVESPLTVSLFVKPQVQQGDILPVNVSVTDSIGGRVTDAEVNVTIGGIVYAALYNGEFYHVLVTNITLPLGLQTLLATADHVYSTGRSSRIAQIEIRSYAIVTVVRPVVGVLFLQGDDDIGFRVNVTDSLGNAIANSSVRILVRETTYLLTDHGNGTYTALVTTSGWAPGNYSYIVFLTHPLLDYGVSINGNVTIVGMLTLDITLSTSTPEQNSTITVTVRVADRYAHSMTGADVTIVFAGTTRVVHETSSLGTYETEVDIGFVSHGQHEVVVCAGHLLCIRTNRTLAIEVSVRAPEISMNTQTFMFGSALSFFISFIGLLIYFRISSSLAVADVTSKGMVKSIRRMDMLYLGIVGLGGLTLVHSFFSAQTGQFGLALTESVLLLGLSVLLYGIWLYRDANYAIIRARRISKKRMILGLWHLIFVPLVIVQIFEWGGRIEWFQYYVLESTFNLGPLIIPTIMLTIFATYISSIGIVVVNLYREIRNGLMRLDHMASGGTPPEIVAEERLRLVGRMGSSIRIKFFMFLVILAATTAMTMDFLRSYSLGIIVLMPVAFLIVIPYVSSKMLKGASKVSGKMRERRPSRASSLMEVADRVTEVSERSDDGSYEPLNKSVGDVDKEREP